MGQFLFSFFFFLLSILHFSFYIIMKEGRTGIFLRLGDLGLEFHGKWWQHFQLCGLKALHLSHMAGW